MKAKSVSVERCHTDLGTVSRDFNVKKHEDPLTFLWSTSIMNEFDRRPWDLGSCFVSS